MTMASPQQLQHVLCLTWQTLANLKLPPLDQQCVAHCRQLSGRPGPALCGEGGTVSRCLSSASAARNLVMRHLLALLRHVLALLRHLLALPKHLGAVMRHLLALLR